MGKYSIEFYDPEPQYGGWYFLKMIDAKNKAVATKKADKIFDSLSRVRVKSVRNVKKTMSELGERDVRHAMKGNY